jgi:hypothetical protein
MPPCIDGALELILKLDLKGLGRLAEEEGFDMLGRLKPPPVFFMHLSPSELGSRPVIIPTPGCPGKQPAGAVHASGIDDALRSASL